MVIAQSPPRLAIIGFGEAGSTIAMGLREAGITDIMAADPALKDPKRQWLRARAEAASIVIVDNVAAMAKADYVFSLVQPGLAQTVARDYAPHIGPGALYVDLTSCGPNQKIAAGDIVMGAGHDFVDAAMLGSVPVSGHRIQTVAAGPRAKEFAERFAPYGMNIEVVGERIGNAAAIKIVRSILAKGVEALFVEALVVARRYGIVDEVLTTFASFMDQHPTRAHAERMVKAHVIHAARRADEVRMSVETAKDAGIDPILTQAIVGVLERTAATGIADKYAGKQPGSFEEALRALDEAIGRR